MKNLPKFKMKLASRIILSVFGSFFLVAVIILLIIGITTSRNAKESGIDLAVSKSRGVSSKVTIYMNQAVEGVTMLKNSLIALKSGNDPRP